MLNSNKPGYVQLYQQIHYRYLQYLIPLVVTLVLSIVFLRDLDDMTLYHVDEGLWIAVGSRAFQEFFIEHDIHDSFWQERYHTWGSYQPQLGKYIIGAGTYFSGYHNVPFLLYDFNKNIEWNTQEGNILDSGIIRSGRFPVALTGIVSCLLLFWIVRITVGMWVGVFAVVSIYHSQLLYISSRRAMIDVPALCFMLLTLVCLIFLRRAIRDANARHMIIWSTATGIACGMAIASKMIGLLSVIICGVIIGIECLYASCRLLRSVGNPLACGTIIFTWTILIFIVSNPFLYPDAIAGTRHLLSLSQLLKTVPAEMTTTLSSKFLAVWNQITGHAPLKQNQLPGDIWLLISGFCALMITMIRRPDFFTKNSLDIITIWIVITYVVITIWLPVNYSRYMLPLQPCNAFLVAYGVGWFVTLTVVQCNRARHEGV